MRHQLSENDYPKNNKTVVVWDTKGKPYFGRYYRSNGYGWQLRDGYNIYTDGIKLKEWIEI